MAEKEGKGGHGPEEYDESTGRYIKQGESDSKYKANLNLSDDNVIKILSGSDRYKPLLDIFNKLTASGKEELKQKFLDEIKDLLNASQTKIDLSSRETRASSSEFQKWSEDAKNKLFEQYGPARAQELLDSFFHGYRGTPKSFVFNHACRVGIDKWFEMHPELKDDPWDGLAAYKKKEADLNLLSESYELPRAVQAHRYLNENYLMGQFKHLFKDFSIIDDGYGYDTIDMSKHTCSEIVDVLQNAIGQMVKNDNACTSWSLTTDSHMEKHRGAKQKRIHIMCDFKKGQKAFPTGYGRESETLVKRDTKIYIKDVKLGHNSFGEEEVQLYYGVV